MLWGPWAADAVVAPLAAQQPAAPSTPPSSPLAFHFGDVDLLPGAFMDMTMVTRSTNTGNGLATNFSNFPFTTSPTGALLPIGNMSETRFSAQNSTLSLQATSKF